MPEFDVVVVGARCAGAPLAMLLSRAGLKVCLVDRSRFPSEVPSTHAIQPNGVAALERFGLGDAIRATGAPPIVEGKIEIDGVSMDFTGDRKVTELTGVPMFCIRRSTLDPVFIEGATAAGAEFRPGTAVTGLVRDAGRVTGVQTAGGPITASLVVGADGPHSAVARFTGAREYHATPPGRLFMWGYFEGVTEAGPRIFLGKSGDTALLAAPTDGELFLVAVVPSLADKAVYLADTTAGLKRGLAGFPEVADIVGPARLDGPVRTMTRWHGYFREATGPGWVLVGDAGHFKDPTPGQGIADAFRQVERLAPAVTAGLIDGSLDGRLQDWGQWRDRDSWDMYWFATDMGAAGPNSSVVNEVIRRTAARAGGDEQFLRVMDHQVSPAELFTPRRALAAAASLAWTGRMPRRVVGRELRSLVGQEISRRRQRRRPRYQSTPPSPDHVPSGGSRVISTTAGG